MPWYMYIAYFAGGLFLANAIPHYVAGVSGAKFQSPFAKPPGVGESSAIVNVVWGFVNFVVAGVLLCGVGHLQVGYNLPTLLAAAGFLLMGLFCASHFSKVRGNA
jgi:hypothetical protein